jgi:two-component system heavy metal sensor histidine kinase CusS
MRDRRSFWRRTDVQMNLAVGGSITALLVGLVALLFVLASHESAEMLESVLDAELRRVAAPLAESTRAPADLESVDEGIAVRLVDSLGEVREVRGRWPVAGRIFPRGTASMRLAFADAQDQLASEVPLPGGSRLEGAISLAGYTTERREQLGQIAVSLAASLLGVIGITLWASRRALAPLRAATRALEAIDERRLDARIAVRGTGDDVDRHAMALNRVLARLEESFRRVSGFSADVAHELRTPVNQMLNHADLAILASGPVPPPEVVRIREASEAMRRLIERLLLLAKGDAGGLRPGRTRVDLREIGGDLADLYRPSCEDRGIALRLSEPGTDAVVEADAGLLQQALSNLLDNALRHAPAGSEIELGVAADATAVRLSVSDAGPGVPEAERERIFDRFVQLDPARSGSGSGLGLAIARMIARAHAGDVTVATSERGGARFEIRVPRHPREPGWAVGDTPPPP